jgi:hypothetical protein
MFKGFSGYVQADAHAIYDALFKGIPPEGAEDDAGERGRPPTEVGCFSHARRKYWEAAVCHHPLGVEGVKLIDGNRCTRRRSSSSRPETSPCRA